MARRTLLVGVALGFLASLLIGARPEAARGQGSTFRILSESYVLVGENIYRADLVNPPVGWHLMPDGSFTLPPVPASSLVSLNGLVGITESGEGWTYNSGGWISIGQIPGVVGVERSTWGALKARYR